VILDVRRPHFLRYSRVVSRRAELGFANTAATEDLPCETENET
jgi:hypothetical protein